MSSGNAFRDSDKEPASALMKALKRAKHLAPANLPAAGQDAGAPERLHPSAREAGIWQRTAHEDTALEVDLLILDYVAYQTTSAALAGQHVNADDAIYECSLGRNLAMINSFLQIFKAKYPSYEADVELRFRLLLLRFATLFTQRLTRNNTTPTKTALQVLRTENHNRARHWIASEDRIPSGSYNVSTLDTKLPLSLDCLERNRAYVLRVLNQPEEDEGYDDAFYGTSSSVSLLDLLPMFMKVVAARNAISASKISKHLMRTAGKFMLQSCIEQYLVRGDSGSDAIDEAFAWGLRPAGRVHDAMEIATGDGPNGQYDDATDELEDEVDAMFADEEEDPSVEVHGWAETKAGFLKQLLLPLESLPQASLQQKLESLAQSHPIADFNADIRGFLTALLASMPEPVLLQLEKGCLDGYTAESTRDFIRDCGLRERWADALSA